MILSVVAVPSFAKEARLNAESVQLDVSGAEKVSYSVKSGSSCTVSDTGLIKPEITTFYWYENTGSYTEIPEKIPLSITKSVKEGQSIVSVIADGKELTVTVDVLSYADYHTEKSFKRFIDNEIKSSMTQFEKLEKITEYTAREHDYGPETSDAVSMAVLGVGNFFCKHGYDYNPL